MLNLKNVETLATAKTEVQIITSQLRATLSNEQLELTNYSQDLLYYQGKTPHGMDMAVEVQLKSLDVYVLLANGQGWIHLRNLNK